MKKRASGFLSKDKILDSEVFDYIQELHDYLWQFIFCPMPWASGKLEEFVDIALKQIQLKFIDERREKDGK